MKENAKKKKKGKKTLAIKRWRKNELPNEK